MKIHKGCYVYFKYTVISIAQFREAGEGRRRNGGKKLTEKKKAGKERLKRTF